MGTAAVYGFKRNNQYKTSMVFADGYPSELGKKFIDFIKSCSIQELNQIFNNIILVRTYNWNDEFLDEETGEIKQSTPITLKDIDHCNHFFHDRFERAYDTDIFEMYKNNEITWSNLLYGIGEKFYVYKKGFKYMLDYSNFEHEDRQWQYIVDLNKNKLIVECSYDEDLSQIFDLGNIPDTYLELIDEDEDEEDEEDEEE